jgi:hypothetical protein
MLQLVRLALLVFTPWLALVLAAPAAGAAPPQARLGWSHDRPAVRARIANGEPLVVHVTVALCHEDIIACGGGGLGNPARPATNLYWGALFGAKRFFDKPALGWTAVPQKAATDGVLERAVYRREVGGSSWGRDRVEQLVVLDAVHGSKIDAATTGFFRRAAEGSTLIIDDGSKRRRLPVAVAGYAGHNRLMDGLRLPASAPSEHAVPSFVLACESGPYFGDALRTSGSSPLVTTRTFMAPEGYVVEAMARALGKDRPASELRAAVVRAYAKWQKISTKSAGRIFTPASQRPAARPR